MALHKVVSIRPDEHLRARPRQIGIKIIAQTRLARAAILPRLLRQIRPSLNHTRSHTSAVLKRLLGTGLIFVNPVWVRTFSHYSLDAREPEPGDYEALVELLGINTNAIGVAVHRLRHQYRDALRDELGAEWIAGAQVDEDLRYLADALR